jgi:hypothetical protein
MLGAGVAERWEEVMQAKQWVTAFSGYVQPPGVPGLDDLIVKVGGHERVLYLAQPGDLVIAEPIVARDGKKVAFTKEELIGGDPKDRKTWDVAEKLYTMDVDGANLRAIVDITPPGRPLVIIPGVRRVRELAWSHDNTKIAYVVLHFDVTPDGVRKVREIPRPEQLPCNLRGNLPWAESAVKLLDVASRQSVVLLPSVRHHSGVGGIITSQAWAPDNRRLVYVNDLSHVIILDTVTRMEEDLGEGENPTWSPDGRFIAFKEPWEIGTERSKKNEGDYILISADPPRKRTILLKNDRPFWNSLLMTDIPVGYVGDALWSPDSRFLLVHRLERLLSPNGGVLYVLDRMTGEIEKAPPGSWGRSWGGKP